MAGPETPESIAAALQEVDAEFKQESDPAWFEKYGQNLADYTHWLFGEFSDPEGGSSVT